MARTQRGSLMLVSGFGFAITEAYETGRPDRKVVAAAALR